MDFELVRLQDFLREASLDRLQEVQREWSQATGFLEKYKSAKAARVEQMIQFKKDYDSGHGTD
jgi:pantoate kinase